MSSGLGRSNASCLCGDVQIDCGTALGTGSYCHCEDCRKQTGSAFSVAVPFDADQFEVLTGSIGSFTKIADSGREITRNFCLRCGSPLFGTSAAFPDLIFVKAGCLHDQFVVSPTHQSWCQSKVTWADIHESSPKYPRSKG